MPKSSPLKSNFTAGEISPKAFGRADISRYPNGAAILENFLIHEVGGAFSRPGTKFAAEAKTSSAGKVRLETFQFSTSQSYVLEFGNLYVRFYTLNGQLLDPTNPVEVTTPYTIDQVFDLQFAQSADVLYIVHAAHEPAKLERTSATTFTLTDITFVGGPFFPDNTGAITVDPDATAIGAVNLVASVDLWTEDHEGALWKIHGTTDDPAVQGYVLITTFTDEQHVAGLIIQTLSADTATTDWAEGAWSNDAGFPSCITFHEQRLTFASSPDLPQNIWASVSLSFEDMTAGTGNSDAFVYTIATTQVNAIRWLDSGPKSLQMGTSGGTFSMSSGTDNTPITPTNVLVQRDTTYGSALILPRRIGNFVYYVQRDLKTLRQLGFNFDVDSNVAEDMTLLADHIAGTLGSDKFIQIAYQQSPNNRLWCIRNDGEVSVLTRQIAQEVIGWSRVVAGNDAQGTGMIESVAVIPEIDANDQVWISVKRVINGSVVRYIEFMTAEDYDAQHDVFAVDSGLSLDSAVTITAATKAEPVVITAASHGFSNGDTVRITDVVGMTELNGNSYKIKGVTTNTFQLTDSNDVDIDGTDFGTYISGGEVRVKVTTISGLTHLVGESVAVLGDGAPQSNQTVTAGGTITLASAASLVHVGLPYVPKVKTLPIESGSAVGTGIGKNKRIYKIMLMLHRSVGFQFGEVSDNLGSLGFQFGDAVDQLDTFIFRTTSTPTGIPPTLVTGIEEMTFPGDWERVSQVLIQQPQPLPLNILAIILFTDLSEE